jgi:hypothetical protein
MSVRIILHFAETFNVRCDVKNRQPGPRENTYADISRICTRREKSPGESISYETTIRAVRIILHFAETFNVRCDVKNRQLPLPFGNGLTGHQFARRRWGCGYATEAANACLDYGFHTQQYGRIAAFRRNVQRQM